MQPSTPEQEAVIRHRTDWAAGDAVAACVQGKWRILRWSTSGAFGWSMDRTYDNDDYIQSNWNLTDERLTNLTVLPRVQIPEPTKFGTIILDANIIRWTYLGPRLDRPWRSEEGARAAWDHLNNPVVIREGIDE